MIRFPGVRYVSLLKRAHSPLSLPTGNLIQQRNKKYCDEEGENENYQPCMERVVDQILPLFSKKAAVFQHVHQTEGGKWKKRQGEDPPPCYDIFILIHNSSH